MNEKKLVAKAKKDKEAFFELYNIYYPKLYAYLLARTKNPELSEDIAQETFVKSLRALKDYRYQGHSFGAWLFKIASNELVSRWRKDKRVASYGDYEKLETELTPIPSRETDILERENAELRNEKQKLLLGALEKLESYERELVTLKYISGLSYKELSVIFKKRPATLAVRLHRILNKLKITLESQSYEK